VRQIDQQNGDTNADHADDARGANGLKVWNLGCGQGHSVIDMVRAFEAASGCPVPYEIVGRRAGDIANCYADPSLANRELGWKTERDLETMCRDLWRWQQFAATLEA